MYPSSSNIPYLLSVQQNLLSVKLKNSIQSFNFLITTNNLIKNLKQTMCLFTEQSDPCNHAECHLVLSIRELNKQVFQKHAKQKQQMGTTGKIISMEKQQEAMHRLDERYPEQQRQRYDFIEQREVQNPQRRQDEIQMMKEQIKMLNNEIQSIKTAMNRYGIPFEG